MRVVLVFAVIAGCALSHDRHGASDNTSDAEAGVRDARNSDDSTPRADANVHEVSADTGGACNERPPCAPGFRLCGVRCAMSCVDAPDWIRTEASTPPFVGRPAMTYDTDLNRVIALHREGTWALADDTWTLLTRTGPIGRSGTAMSYDSDQHRVVLFGGRSGDTPFDDTWFFQNGVWRAIRLSGPSARDSHAMAYDSELHRVVLFGGLGPFRDDGTVDDYNDTWILDNDTWRMLETTGPVARIGHAMAYDSTLHRTVLFGGWFYSDTWILTGGSWTRLRIAGPSGRHNHAMAYDSVRERTVLFGGVSDGCGGRDVNDTWVLNRDTWTQLDSGGPLQGFAMAYDASTRRMVLVGTNEAAINPATLETWAYP